MAQAGESPAICAAEGEQRVTGAAGVFVVDMEATAATIAAVVMVDMFAGAAGAATVATAEMAAATVDSLYSAMVIEIVATCFSLLQRYVLMHPELPHLPYAAREEKRAIFCNDLLVIH